MDRVEKMIIKELLLEHAQMYPVSEATDYIKLLHQGEFGGGHLIADAQMPLNYLKREMETVADSAEHPFDEIGGGLLRMHLRAVRPLGLRPETVTGLFLQTCAPRGSVEKLNEKLDVFLELCGENPSMPDCETASAAVNAYRAAGCPATRHSQTYRDAYQAAYRLVPEQARTFLPLFQNIDALLNEKPFVRIAIDGRCASGKTTLAALLQNVYNANLIHMDDYFLPFPRKTPERLAEPGGNVDYERFAEEVAAQPADKAFEYRPFDCSIQALGESVRVEPKPLLIVEGSYSHHPTLRDAYDLTVFLSVDPETQSARILNRNGPEMHARFVNEWIPMEEHYFSALGIRERSNLVFDL